MTPTDRIVAYKQRLALVDAVDPLEFQRRYLKGLKVQAQLHQPRYKAGNVLAINSIRRKLHGSRNQ